MLPVSSVFRSVPWTAINVVGCAVADVEDGARAGGDAVHDHVGSRATRSRRRCRRPAPRSAWSRCSNAVGVSQAPEVASTSCFSERVQPSACMTSSSVWVSASVSPLSGRAEHRLLGPVGGVAAVVLRAVGIVLVVVRKGGRAFVGQPFTACVGQRPRRRRTRSRSSFRPGRWCSPDCPTHCSGTGPSCPNSPVVERTLPPPRPPMRPMPPSDSSWMSPLMTSWPKSQL